MQFAVAYRSAAPPEAVRKVVAERLRSAFRPLSHRLDAVYATFGAARRRDAASVECRIRLLLQPRGTLLVRARGATHAAALIVAVRRAIRCEAARRRVLIPFGGAAGGWKGRHAERTSRVCPSPA
jgi:hypothetical protein